MQTRVNLAADSRYLGWEILCLGRSAAGEKFTRGSIALHTRIERAGQAVWLERGRLLGDDAMLHSPVGWNGSTVCATLLTTLLPGNDAMALLAACRAIQPDDATHTGLTALPGLLAERRAA